MHCQSYMTKYVDEHVHRCLPIHLLGALLCCDLSTIKSIVWFNLTSNLSCNFSLDILCNNSLISEHKNIVISKYYEMIGDKFDSTDCFGIFIHSQVIQTLKKFIEQCLIFAGIFLIFMGWNDYIAKHDTSISPNKRWIKRKSTPHVQWNPQDMHKDSKSATREPYKFMTGYTTEYTATIFLIFSSFSQWTKTCVTAHNVKAQHFRKLGSTNVLNW